MSKLTKIAVGAVAFWAGLTLLHARLNLGLDPLAALGARNEVAAAETTRFRVGFLPVT